MHARKLPRINQDSYREDYDKNSYNRNKIRVFRGRNSFHDKSPDGDSEPQMLNSKGYRDRDGRDYAREYNRKSNNHDRDRSPRDRKWAEYKDKDLDRQTGVGDWTEHKSSTGKRYYYNSQTEVSQWEKPREWIEYERARQNNDWRDGSDGISRNIKPAKLICDRSSRGSQEKHSASPLDAVVSSRGSLAPLLSSSHHHITSTPSSSHTASSRTPRSAVGHHSLLDGCGGGKSGDATPTSSEATDGGGYGGSNQGSLDARLNSAYNHHHHQQHLYHSSGGVSVSGALSRVSGGLPSSASTPTSCGTIPSYNSLPSTTTTLPSLIQNSSLSVRVGGWNSPLSASSQSPPTPTHTTHHTLQQAVLSPLQQLQQSTPITITASLARHYREELISHVQNWPAEQLERGCQKVWEEGHSIAAHGITRVSAELKMARSLVRLADIQATLQEQRIIFLRQQMQDLERYGVQNLPNSKNSDSSATTTSSSTSSSTTTTSSSSTSSSSNAPTSSSTTSNCSGASAASSAVTNSSSIPSDNSSSMSTNHTSSSSSGVVAPPPSSLSAAVTSSHAAGTFVDHQQ